MKYSLTKLISGDIISELGLPYFVDLPFMTLLFGKSKLSSSLYFIYCDSHYFIKHIYKSDCKALENIDSDYFRSRKDSDIRKAIDGRYKAIITDGTWNYLIERKL